ncbi:kinase subdomain-containing [Lecanosticta acicola]|uniref:Kinase subdomain-containing n=1 Tax=Lecanosticta acicola TaxID=111012 RepID=A0AAI9EE32_9PEZI|nr:kinase subdomain-containing [Lecanosticta acicola]
MERVHGEDLPRAWKRLPKDGRHDMFTQLKAMFHELRTLTPPLGTGVESCTGGSLYDSRIKRGPRFGPFRSIQDFHFWLREELRPSEFPSRPKDQEWQDIENMVAMQDGPWPPPVFTHADLNPFNILVRDDKVVAVIDWDFAGWYPNYWEYTSAWYGNITRTGWQDELGQFLDTFSAELEMERTRQKWWGEV